MAPDGDQQIPPDIDTADLDDKNFATGDLAQAWGLLSAPRFLLHKDRKDVEAYFVQDVSRRTLGQVIWTQNGGWAVNGPQGNPLAMLWRQHTEDHSQENLKSLVHMGFHRYEQAVHDEENASIYCLANLDKTVRLFVTFKGDEAILDSPSNRPVLKMAKGQGIGDVGLVDAFDDPVANIHTESTALVETHDVTMLEAEDPFLVALFGITIALEMSFRHGNWRSPYAHTEL
jgi:hypothetical protein